MTTEEAKAFIMWAREQGAMVVSAGEYSVTFSDKWAPVMFDAPASVIEEKKADVVKGSMGELRDYVKSRFGIDSRDLFMEDEVNNVVG